MSEPTPLLSPLKPKAGTARLWRGDRFEPDTWLDIADDAPLPGRTAVIVSAARWARDRDLKESHRSIGVRILTESELVAVGPDLSALALVVLSFPKFSDGRAYSFARRLREFGFRHEIRATGDVLLDQLPLMLRAGFSSFEITNAATIDALEKRPLPTVSRVYQAAEEAVPYAWRSRRRVG